MNVSLRDATITGNDKMEYHFDEFFVKARNIRYVQIPDDVSESKKLKILLVVIKLFIWDSI